MTIVALDPVTLVTVLLFLTFAAFLTAGKEGGRAITQTHLNQLNLYSNQLTRSFPSIVWSVHFSSSVRPSVPRP